MCRVLEFYRYMSIPISNEVAQSEIEIICQVWVNGDHKKFDVTVKPLLHLIEIGWLVEDNNKTFLADKLIDVLMYLSYQCMSSSHVLQFYLQ